MSTRSIIARQDGDSWKGRYAHWDGYPMHQGKSIWNIVQRDGFEKAARTFTDENYYWSTVSPFQESTADDEGRWKIVEGYGCAGDESEASPDEWHTPKDLDDTWCEWVYVITQGGLMVIYIATQELIGFYQWNGEEPNWEKVQEKAYANA